MPIEFSSNISLHQDDKDRFQFVYATQIYGTLLGVFAKFVCDAEANNSMKMNEIQFLGINYKGLLSIEIETPNMPIMQHWKPANPGDPIDPTKPKSLNLFLPLKVSLNAFQPDIKNPTKLDVSAGNFNMKRGDYFRIDRLITPLGDINGATLQERAFGNGIFDDELYVRDGLMAKARQDDPNNMDYKVPRDRLVVDDVMSNPVSRSHGPDEPSSLASIRCTPGNNKIFF